MTSEIEVWRYGEVVGAALVDDQDAYLGESAYLGKTHWRLNPDGYAQRSAGPRGRDTLLLHREIMGNPSGKLIDHINGHGLDCQRDNLRTTNAEGNSQNRRGAQKNSSTGVRGVYLRPDGRYQGRVSHRGKKHCAGTFGSTEEAKLAVAAMREKFSFLTGAEDLGAGQAAS